jgi:hypothetical protein
MGGLARTPPVLFDGRKSASTLTADFNGGQPQSRTPVEFDLTPGVTTASMARHPKGVSISATMG